MVTVTGWGTTSEGALGLPNVLHKVILVVKLVKKTKKGYCDGGDMIVRRSFQFVQ